jgi:CheY-like chemotaxis protein
LTRESPDIVTERPRLQERAQNERPHVLIVSDDTSLSTFLEEGLPLGGFWTSVIASGLQALEVFRLRQFDLIVIDWSLQSFGAQEFLRRLRGVSTRTTSTESRTGAPAVIISEAPVDLPVEEQARLGISRMLRAPLEIDEVARELHMVFQEWRRAYPDAPLSDDPSRATR